MTAPAVAAAGPAVTVIIATYRQPQLLRLAVQSVLRQSFTDFELWVIGDGCTDTSAEAIGEFDDRRLFWHNLSTNSGSPSAPHNEGLRRARGRYIAYLGHDDLWFPWHLSMLITAAEAQSAAVAYGTSIWVLPGGALQIRGPAPDATDPFLPRPLPIQYLHARALVGDRLAWRDPWTLGTSVNQQFWRELCEAAGPPVQVPRISSLHFPSTGWRSYAAGAELPQATAWTALTADPAAYEQTLLNAFAHQQARISNEPVSFRQSLVLPFKLLYRRLLQGSASDRWPVRWWSRWRQRRQIRRNRRQRGLPPLSPGPP